MWGFWEGLHWRPNAAIWKKDWAQSKSALEYRKLVYDKWWTQCDGVANGQGEYETKVFFGCHSVAVGAEEQKMVWVDKKEASKTVIFHAD